MKSLFTLLLLVSMPFPVLAQSQERPVEKAFKGIELYSWQDSNGHWLFALAIGTNRLKTETEIKNGDDHICGVKELEKHLMRLATGEQVLWFHRDLKGFVYPDEKMMKDILSLAKKANVDLHVQPKTKPN